MDICYILKFSTHGHDSLRSWIYKLNEMDADHVAGINADPPTSATAKCFAKPIIEQKEIDEKGGSTLRSLLFIIVYI